MHKKKNDKLKFRACRFQTLAKQYACFGLSTNIYIRIHSEDIEKAYWMEDLLNLITHRFGRPSGCA